MLRYPAFLSYSRRDLAFARKLHAELEAYRIPKNAGASGHSEKGDRISPVFRDQDEVSASSDLGDTLTNALNQSSAMILIASPDAAASKWVNAEVEQFSKLGRANRIFVAIPPYIPTDRDFDIRSIFPPALLALGEPLAADFRKTCDGWTLAKLKIVAGVAGIDLVRLRDRDAARRLRTMVISMVAGVAVLGALGTAGYTAFQAEMRAKQERVARSLEGIRNSLLADQPGNALAFLQGFNRGDVSAEEAAGLNRLSLFWNANLTSPRDAIAAAPPGSQLEIGSARYFRTSNGIAPMPAVGVAYTFQSTRNADLIIQDNNGGYTRLDPATGAMTDLLSTLPERIHTDSGRLFELPDGALVAMWSAGDGSVGTSWYVATVIYPDGSTSGVLRNMIFGEFRTDPQCTRLYFVGPSGFDPTFTQVLSAEGDTGRGLESQLTLNVTSLVREAQTPEGTVQLDPALDFQTAALDWLDAKGPRFEDACASVRLTGTPASETTAARFTIPSFSGDGWRRDNAVSPLRTWSQQAWLDASMLPIEAEYSDVDLTRMPDRYAETENGRFVIFAEEEMGAHTAHLITLFCAQPVNGAARCATTNSSQDDGRLTLLPQAGLVAMGGDFGFFDFTSMAPIDWSGGDERRLVAESSDGRTIMSLTDTGELTVMSYERGGGGPSHVRSLTDAAFGDGTALAVLSADDALIVTRDGRLIRVNTTTGAVEWTFRDRTLVSSTAVDDWGHSATVAVSPNRHFAAVATATGLRLYELSLGAPLTTLYRFADGGARSALSNISLAIADDGAVVAGSGGLAFVRDAPQPRTLSESDTACLYGARIVDGRAVTVDVFGDPEMRRHCGFDTLAPN